MTPSRSRRDWLKEIGAIGAGSILGGAAPTTNAPPPTPQTPTPGSPPNGAILALTSSSDVLIPPRGRAYQKFSFDFPEAAVAFEGLSFAFRIFTGENTYALDRAAVSVTPSAGGLEISCSSLVFAGGQQRTPGRLTARLATRDGVTLCDAEAEIDRPVTALAIIVRGVPRGRLSADGAPFFDPGDDEVLLGYPFPAAICSVRKATAG